MAVGGVILLALQALLRRAGRGDERPPRPGGCPDPQGRPGRTVSHETSGPAPGRPRLTQPDDRSPDAWPEARLAAAVAALRWSIIGWRGAMRYEVELDAGGGDAFLLAGQQGQARGYRLRWGGGNHRSRARGHSRAWRTAATSAAYTGAPDRSGTAGRTCPPRWRSCRWTGSGLGHQPGQQRRPGIEHDRHRRRAHDGARAGFQRPDRRGPGQRQLGASISAAKTTSGPEPQGLRPPAVAGLAGQRGGHHRERTGEGAPRPSASPALRIPGRTVRRNRPGSGTGPLRHGSASGRRRTRHRFRRTASR